MLETFEWLGIRSHYSDILFQITFCGTAKFGEIELHSGKKDGIVNCHLNFFHVSSNSYMKKRGDNGNAGEAQLHLAPWGGIWFLLYVQCARIFHIAKIHTTHTHTHVYVTCEYFLNQSPRQQHYNKI